MATFAGYYHLYDGKTEEDRIRFLFELLFMVFPMVCSISTAYCVRQEEQIPNFYGLLFYEKKWKLLLGKLLFGYGIGNTSFFLVVLAMLGVGSKEKEILLLLVALYFGGAILTLFFFVLHLWLNLKWGIGVSVIVGVLGSMQAVIYSNIKLEGGFRYIPFGWLMEWIKMVFCKDITAGTEFLCECAGITMVTIALFLCWFARWEGRKQEVA